MEQCAKAGCVSQTAGGAPAGRRGDRPTPEVRLVRCGAAHLQGALSQERALQVEFLESVCKHRCGLFYFFSSIYAQTIGALL